MFPEMGSFQVPPGRGGRTERSPWRQTAAGPPSLIQMLHEGVFFFFGCEFSTGVRAPHAVGQESVRSQPTPSCVQGQ